MKLIYFNRGKLVWFKGIIYGLLGIIDSMFYILSLGFIYSSLAYEYLIYIYKKEAKRRIK